MNEEEKKKFTDLLQKVQITISRILQKVAIQNVVQTQEHQFNALTPVTKNIFKLQTQ